MRKMRNKATGEVHVVKEHMVLRNLWEYYVTDYDEENIFGLILGFEDEWGWSSLPDMHDAILSRTKKLSAIAPAPGYEWV